MPVCRQWGTDAERCVLIFVKHWDSLAAMLDRCDVMRVSVLYIELRDTSVQPSIYHGSPVHVTALPCMCSTFALSHMIEELDYVPSVYRSTNGKLFLQRQAS